jgi:hypothetical protein
MIHKSEIEDIDCKCKECSLRFSCFTQERIFSDSLFQALFEALVAQGKSKEQALEEVTVELKARIGQGIQFVTIYPEPTVAPFPMTPWVSPNTIPYSNPTFEWTCQSDDTKRFKFALCSNGDDLDYHMCNGDVVKLKL